MRIGAPGDQVSHLDQLRVARVEMHGVFNHSTVLEAETTVGRAVRRVTSVTVHEDQAQRVRLFEFGFEPRDEGRVHVLPGTSDPSWSVAAPHCANAQPLSTPEGFQTLDGDFSAEILPILDAVVHVSIGQMLRDSAATVDVLGGVQLLDDRNGELPPKLLPDIDPRPEDPGPVVWRELDPAIYNESGLWVAGIVDVDQPIESRAHMPHLTDPGGPTSAPW